MIETRNLSLRRGAAPILSDLTLSLPTGKIIALIGPNGAGKSTLLHCIAGLLRPQAGQVQVMGEDIHALPEARRALHLSLLTQSQGILPRLSVAELVAFGRWPHHRGRPGPADAAVVEDALTRFDLDPLRQREVETLSGGQKQRAYLAMAFAQSSPWMLLDEPLAALDPKFTRDIMERLRLLVQALERSVLLVVHDLQIAAGFADWIVGLKDGQVAFDGPAETQLTSKRLSALYDTPLRLAELDGTRVLLPA